MRARTAVAAFAALVSAFAPMHARAAVAVVATPGAATVGYATPVVVWVKGSEPLRFVNLDPVAHDVVSDETRLPGTASWCPANGPRCPLFTTNGLVTIARAEPILGLEDAEPGVPYRFYCTPHDLMVGTLVVVAP